MRLTPAVMCQCRRRPRACSVPLAASLSTREAADRDPLSLLSLSDLLISLSLSRQHLISLGSASPGLTRVAAHPTPGPGLMLHPGDGGTGPRQQLGASNTHLTLIVIEI